MTNVYLIQAHQYPFQLKRLIERINYNDVFFYIHIDLKVDIKPFKDLISGKNIVFIDNRIDCIWGDFSQVQATLNLCTEVLNYGFDIDTRITLLSGQDYPIKSIQYIDTFLNNNKDINFINIEKIDRNRIHHLKNLKAFKLNHSNKRLDYTLISIYHYKNILKALFKRKILFSDIKYIFMNRNIPLDMTPYRGSSWWSLNIKIMVEILDLYNSNSCVFDAFYCKTLSPDENFFQTILMYLREKDKSIKINSSLTYDNWERSGVDLPITFELNDYEELLSQPDNKLFARKFNSVIDNNILNKLDEL